MKTNLSQHSFCGLYHLRCLLPDWPGQNKSDTGIYSTVTLSKHRRFRDLLPAAWRGYPLRYNGTQLYILFYFIHREQKDIGWFYLRNYNNLLFILQWNTVYPKKYAHGFCFAVLCCGYTLTDFPISIRLTSLALWQSNDCPSDSKATLMNMDKYFMWIHYERLQNHNKAKHYKIACIFLGIYCTWHVDDLEVHSPRASTGMEVINLSPLVLHICESDLHWFR